MIGRKFGSYEILDKLGAGGMGEVYRARDTRLDRDVALKLVPEIFARHPDYLARFEREARLLAAISHPNVAGIYDVADGGDARALVLELVDGPTLDELIADTARRGEPLAIDRAIEIARQIALGLEAVHEKGIVHRDLKPANIKISADGVVKVLDFGLGRIADATSADATAATSADAVTRAGTVLGTAAYMSPEQARGTSLDKRADIWAFGCVLFELVTGARAFPGDTWSDTLARVIAGEPDWARLPPQAPPALHRVLRRCLEKDARRRLRDIGDARLDLEEALSQPAAATDRLAIGHAADVRVERLTDAVGIAGSPALSPDGKMIAFVAVANGRRHIWIRMIAGGAPLQITRADADHDAPRWTADSGTIIYYSAASHGANGHLWRISALGGTPRRIAPATGGCDVSHDGRRLAFFQATETGVALVITGARRRGAGHVADAQCRVPLRRRAVVTRRSRDRLPPDGHVVHRAPRHRHRHRRYTAHGRQRRLAARPCLVARRLRDRLFLVGRQHARVSADQQPPDRRRRRQRRSPADLRRHVVHRTGHPPERPAAGQPRAWTLRRLVLPHRRRAGGERPQRRSHHAPDGTDPGAVHQP